jgi:hypothetical protein
MEEGSGYESKEAESIPQLHCFKETLKSEGKKKNRS